MKHSKKLAFTMLEMAVTSGITAVVVGTTCAVTLMCAKLTRTSVSTSSNGSLAQTNLQRICSDISKAEAVLTTYTFSGSSVSGGLKKGKSGSTEIVLRIPNVDSAGRPLPGQYRVVDYIVGSGSKGTNRLLRLTTQVSGGLAGPAKLEDLGQTSSLSFTYLGKSSKMGGAIKNTVGAVDDLTTGQFDGAVTVDPSTALLPNVSGAIFVQMELCSEDKGGKQKLRTGARLRNSNL